MQNQTIRKHPRPMRTISMRRRAKVIFSLWVCGCSIIRQTAVSPPHERRNLAAAQFAVVIIPYRETAKAVFPPRQRRNPAAAGSIWCNKRSARRLPRRPAIGGLNWAAAQFAVVIIPYRETAKAVFPPRQRRNPAAAGSIWCNKRSARRLPRRPAIGGLNWAAAQFAVVIIPQFYEQRMKV